MILADNFFSHLIMLFCLIFEDRFLFNIGISFCPRSLFTFAYAVSLILQCLMQCQQTLQLSTDLGPINLESKNEIFHGKTPGQKKPSPKPPRQRIPK